MLKPNSALRSPWVLTFIFMFCSIVVANGVLLYFATTNPRSLVAENYYDRGQDYEQNMLKRMAKDPGWNMDLIAPNVVKMDVPASFKFVLFDKQGKVVNPDAVTFYAYRPSDSRADFSLPMVKLSAGNYQVDATFALKGVWDLIASVTRGDDEFNVALRVRVSVN